MVNTKEKIKILTVKRNFFILPFEFIFNLLKSI
ncbi:unnamed protein product, partial [marine sediment metagenome]